MSREAPCCRCSITFDPEGRLMLASEEGNRGRRRSGRENIYISRQGSFLTPSKHRVTTLSPTRWPECFGQILFYLSV